MKRIPLWIDCDPGVDDAAAILAALQIEELDIKGVSAVSGNVLLDKTFPNARDLVSLGGREDIPVYPGAMSPLRRESVTAAYVHGENGLGGAEIPPSAAPMREKKAWDALYEAALEAEGELVLVAVGPLTNIGLALAKYGDLPRLIKKAVIMGGSATMGNTTPAAEFNVYVDPEAADMLFASGIPVVMCGLDVTLKAMVMPDEIDALAEYGPQGKFLNRALQCSLAFVRTFGFEGVPLHDVCPILYCVEPELFTTELAGVRVETKGKYTAGKTVTDLYSDSQMEIKNALVALDVNREAFAARFMALMKKYRR